jgi:hypothetical protein
MMAVEKTLRLESIKRFPLSHRHDGGGLKYVSWWRAPKPIPRVPRSTHPWKNRKLDTSEYLMCHIEQFRIYPPVISNLGNRSSN